MILRAVFKAKKGDKSTDWTPFSKHGDVKCMPSGIYGSDIYIYGIYDLYIYHLYIYVTYNMVYNMVNNVVYNYIYIHIYGKCLHSS